jgi:molybdopterin converting factor small subunit
MSEPDAAEVTVRLSGGLRHLAGERRAVHIRGATVGEAVAALADRYPSVRSRLRDERGRLRPSVLVFLNSEDIRAADGEDTAVHDGDELHIVPVSDGG